MRKTIINYVLLISITITVLYFSLKDNYNDIINNIVNVNLGWLILAIILVFVYLLFKAISLRNLINKTDNRIHFIKILKIISIVEFFQNITPFSSGSQPAQLYLLKKEGIRISTATNIITQQFLVYQIPLVIYGIIAIILNGSLDIFPDVSIMNKIVLFGFIIDFFIVLFLLLVSFGKNINYKFIRKTIIFLSKIKIFKNKEKMLMKADNIIDKFYEGGLTFKENKLNLLKDICCNFIALTSFYLVPIMILYGFGYYNVSVINVLVGSALIRFIAAFIPSPGAIGGMELGYITFFGNFVKGPVLLSSMLLWRFVTYYFPIIVGNIFFIFYKRKGWLK